MNRNARAALAALSTLDMLGDRLATPEERDLLLGWPGWGPLAPALGSDPRGEWAQARDEVFALLPDDPEAITEAVQGTDTAFYTPPSVVKHMWDLVVDAGFTGGRVLEPGCGSGRFISGAPEDMLAEFVGVERDPTVARIAQASNPGAQIVCSPLEEHTIRDGSFDLVIGNVPFAAGSVWDSAFKRRSVSLHDYFLGRSLAAVRHGGYVAVVISRSVMDNGDLLAELADEDSPLVRADFVGAVRLPTGTFRAGGTDVVADLVLLRRNTDTSRPVDLSRATPGRCSVDGAERGYRGDEDALVSKYWFTNPGHVAGQMREGTHFSQRAQVLSNNRDAAITAAMRQLSTQLLPYALAPSMGDPTQEFADVVLCDGMGRKKGSFHLDGDNGVVQIEDGRSVPRKTSRELVDLIGLRDLANRLLEAEANWETPDILIDPLRDDTRQAWEAYVAAYGPLNRGTLHEGVVDAETGMPKLSWRRPRMGGFRADPDYVTVIALEAYSQDTGAVGPAAILLRRVNRRPARVESAESASEALAITLGECGHVNVERVGELLGISADTVEAALGHLVFRDPAQCGQLVTDRDYLSGANVRHKLRVAEQAAAGDPAYQRNVTALTETVPPDLGPVDIEVTFGAPWVKAADVTAFLKDLLFDSENVRGNMVCTVHHSSVVASWEVVGARPNVWLLDIPASTTTYGTARVSTFVLVENALNGKTPVVVDEVIDSNGHTKRIRNAEQTLAAQEKLSLVKAKFNEWVWADDARSARIAAEYNEKMNSTVARRNDGSYLTFPGLADGVVLWDWQRNIVDQIISSGATLCGHAVGAGKTLSMIAACVTMRQFGLATKPIIAVPNHLLEQIAREARQAFPAAKFLIAGKDDLTGQARRVFAARCATGDWDAVVVTHSGFSSIPVSSDTEAAWVANEKYDLEKALRTEEGGHYGAKQIARRLRTIETRLRTLRAAASDPNTVLFEHLGIDCVLVDEAHVFKRLPITTRVEGFSLGSSKRATDLLMKVEWLAERSGGTPHAAFFTGTPWTNTLAETYVWQRYVQPDLLHAAGLRHFDTWASAHVLSETKIEVAPDGSGFRVATRPSAFVNVPELLAMLKHNADILPTSAIPLERPDAVLDTVTVDPGPGQSAYVAALVERAEKLRNGTSNRVNDNMLAVCGDGRRAALDPHLVGVPEDSPKLAAVAQRVTGLYQQSKTTAYGGSPVSGSLQIVFCDQGTPGARGDQTYGRLRSALITNGVPADKIRFVHDAKTDQAKGALFAACRDGSVAVLLGSTEKMGLGTNVQTRAVAVHHIDAPWRPSDIEQRNGRAVRPKNLNSQVDIIRYVTAGTFDAYMWQALERKATFIAQMVDGSVGRSVQDIGDVVLDYGQVKALASGNTLLLDHAQALSDVKRLRVMRSVDAQGVAKAKREAVEDECARQEWAGEATRLKEFIAEPPSLQMLDHQILALHEAARGNPKTFYDNYLGSQWRMEIATKRSWGKERWNPEIFITRSYSPVGRIPLNPKRLATSRRSAHAHVQQELGRWQENAPAQLSALRDRISRVAAAIDYKQTLAESYVFAKENELTAAQARLDRIEAEIEEEAATDTKADADTNPVAA